MPSGLVPTNAHGVVHFPTRMILELWRYSDFLSCSAENPSNYFRISQFNHYWWGGIPSKKSLFALYELQLALFLYGFHRDSQEACVLRHDERVTRLVATHVFLVP